MDSYSNRINRIKFSIEEIRECLEKTKQENERTINTIFTRVSPTYHNYTTSETFGGYQTAINDNDNQLRFERYNPFLTYTFNEYSNNYRNHYHFNRYVPIELNFDYSYSSPNTIINNTYEYQNNPYDHYNFQYSQRYDDINKNKNSLKENINNSDESIDNSNNSQKIQKLHQEMLNLKSEINKLQNKNEALIKEIQSVREKNEKAKKEKNNEEQALNIIMKYLKVKSYEEIIPQIESLISSQNNQRENNNNEIKSPPKKDKVKDELIEKLKNRYLEYHEGEKKEDVDIKTIWRWIKSLLPSIKNLSDEKIKYIETKKQLESSEKYQKFCEKVIKDYQLNTFNNFKEHITNLLSKESKKSFTNQKAKK